MDYDDWKKEAEQAGIEVNEFHRRVGMSKNAVLQSARRKEMQVLPRFIYMLKGVIFDSDDFLRQCDRHRSNAALQALLDDLDSR